jgi:hypothetical protein
MNLISENCYSSETAVVHHEDAAAAVTVYEFTASLDRVSHTGVTGSGEVFTGAATSNRRTMPTGGRPCPVTLNVHEPASPPSSIIFASSWNGVDRAFNPNI